MGLLVRLRWRRHRVSLGGKFRTRVERHWNPFSQMHMTIMLRSRLGGLLGWLQSLKNERGAASNIEAGLPGRCNKNAQRDSNQQE